MTHLQRTFQPLKTQQTQLMHLLCFNTSKPSKEKQPTTKPSLREFDLAMLDRSAVAAILAHSYLSTKSKKMFLNKTQFHLHVHGLNLLDSLLFYGKINLTVVMKVTNAFLFTDQFHNHFKLGLQVDKRVKPPKIARIDSWHSCFPCLWKLLVHTAY